MQEHHEDEFRKYEAEKAVMAGTGKKCKLENVTQQKAEAKRQNMLTEVLEWSSSNPMKHVSQVDFEEHLVNMLVEDMQPLAMVERQGFRKFCASVLSKYVLPSHRTLNRRLHDIHTREKEKFQ